MVTALATGTVTVTAAAVGLSGTTTITVRQEATAVAITGGDAQINVDETLQLDATAADANGNAIAAAIFEWASSDPSIATVSEVGVVTGVAPGGVAISVASDNANATTAITILDPPQDFAPTGDGSAGGTMEVLSVTIPAGVTITATSDLVINASGAVEIAGSIGGDCVAISLTGAAAVTITGTIDNSCSAPGQTAPAVTIVGAANMLMDGAIITSAGSVSITNSAAASAVAASVVGSSATLARSARMVGTCDYNGNTQVRAAAGEPGVAGGSSVDGMAGGNVSLGCDGDMTIRDATFGAGDGGDGAGLTGADATPKVAGRGGDGGRVEIAVTGDLTIQPSGSSPLALSGGKGGDGGWANVTNETPGGDATATGGAGGDSPFPSVVVGGTITGPLDIVLQNSGAGGKGWARAGQGQVPAGAGGNARAIGGAAGTVGPPTGEVLVLGHVVQGTVLGTVRLQTLFTAAAPGGGVLAGSGNGAPGSVDSPDGGAGGSLTALAGPGASINVNNNTGAALEVTTGAGGGGVFGAGNGGAGFHQCFAPSAIRGGMGGVGGSSTVGNGVPGGGLGTPGSIHALFSSNTGNGANGGAGDPVGAGGAAGTLDVVFGQAIPVDSKPSFQPGIPGPGCVFLFELVVSLLQDQNGHDCCTGATAVTQLSFQVFADGFESGSTSAWSSSAGSFGSGSGVAGAGLGMVTLMFNSTGVGTVAGFADVTHTLNGNMTLDDDGFPASFEAVLVLDSNNDRLPADANNQRNPVSYTVSGTLSSGPGGE